MNVLEIYAVYDKKVGVHMTPFFVRSEGEARRVFLDIFMNEEHSLTRHAGDYDLYYIGTFEENSGNISRDTVCQIWTGLEARKVALQAKRSENHAQRDDPSLQ